MGIDLSRRRFLVGLGAMAGASNAVSLAGATIGVRPDKPLRLGFVGIGNRGAFHLDLCLGIPAVEVNALCDPDEANLAKAKRWVEESGRPVPRLYSRGETDFRRMCDDEDLDLVVCSTPWEWHAPVSLAAMRADKHAATEVPVAVTVEECWELVETAEEHRRECVMLEQVNYGRFPLLIHNMIRAGAFGEPLWATGGYLHDLRAARFDPSRKPWRQQHHLERNGNLYPTHPIGPIAWWFDINRGDRFDHLVSMSSQAVMVNAFAQARFGSDNHYATAKMKQGDVNVSLIRTANDKVITLFFDTNTPHPHTGELRMQASKGVFVGNSQEIFLEGRTPEDVKWEPAQQYAEQYEHGLWKAFAELDSRNIRGHGGGRHNVIMWHRLLRAIQDGKPQDMDVYDAVTWSVIAPLTEQSVAARSRAVDFPDFTRGKWKTNGPVDLG